MTVEATQLWDLFSLFPALAGVIPELEQQKYMVISFPRTRGGDPLISNFIKGMKGFSPHSRG